MPANNRSVVAEAAVAMNLAQVGEQPFDIIERLRPLRMAGKFRFLPGGLQSLHFLSQNVKAFVELCQLAMSLRVLPRRGLNRCALVFRSAPIPAALWGLLQFEA